MNLTNKMMRAAATVAFGLTLTSSARAAIDLTFDVANSNIGAGIYAFDLAGIPAVPIPTYNSSFDLFNFATIHNTQNPLIGISSPTGWNLSGPNDINSANWAFENTSGLVNGIFEVQATKNLAGTINWTFADAGHNEHASGTVTISAIPEPAQYGLIFGSLGLVAMIISSRQHLKRPGQCA